MTAADNIAADAESAVIVPADAASLTGPEGPDTAAPDADPTSGGDARVEAVWAALNAEPGTSATTIGAAAGLSRMVAGKILNQLETDGRARREPGTNDGQTRGRAADRWYPITTNTGDITDPDSETSGTEAGPANDAGAPAAQEETLPASTETADVTPKEAPEAVTGDEPSDEDPTGETHGQPDALTDDEGPADAHADEPAVEAADDPAWARVRAELAELTDLFGGVALAKDDGNAVMALGCLEMAMARVTSVHRNARAALTGTAAPDRPASAARPGTASSGGVGSGVRPGALRDRVHAHLIEFPDKDFTPYEIGKVLDASSGAVANALDRLVNLGDAVLTCERPRRFALAPTANPTQVPTEPGTPAEAADTSTG
ncbi:hypothetical protein AB0M95_36585 [Sphaerisporangium sp. NPDC051017]|uniref:hypothetical protein n=1 Tax=Sphaerisporangium sp. NPDC051017 TaxID=3154636 RepID=UPI00344ADAC3